MRPSAHIDPKRLPRERLLKNALPDVTGKKQPFGRLPRIAAKKRMCATVMSWLDRPPEIERRLGARRDFRRQFRKVTRFRASSSLRPRSKIDHNVA
jgi:hypothetical protein